MDSTLQLMGPQARKVILRSDINWEHFADGFPKLFIENVKDMAGRDGEGSNVQSCWEKRHLFWCE